MFFVLHPTLGTRRQNSALPSACAASDKQSNPLFASGVAWLERPCPKIAMPVGYMNVSLKLVDGWDVVCAHSTHAVKWGLYQGRMHVAIVDDARSVHMVLPMGMSGSFSGSVLKGATKDW